MWLISHSLSWVLNFRRAEHDSDTNGQKTGNSCPSYHTEDPKRNPFMSPVSFFQWMHHLEGKCYSCYSYHYSRARGQCRDQVPVVLCALQINTWCIHALGSTRDKGNIISMPVSWGMPRLSDLPKVTQEVSGRTGNWTQISWIAGQGFNHKAIFRLSFFFPSNLSILAHFWKKKKKLHLKIHSAIL